MKYGRVPSFGGINFYAPPPEQKKMLTVDDLSAEQKKIAAAALAGFDVRVDAVLGSGKTTLIQVLCNALCVSWGERTGTHRRPNILYLTFSRLLKIDAQSRVRGAKVQNYHGIVYPALKKAGISCGISESVAMFNENFETTRQFFPTYDILVVDEYQDLTEDYANLLTNIRSMNESMQVIMVGDQSQKVHSNTRLDSDAFVSGFLVDPVVLPLTQSFRMGPRMGELLGKAWGRDITGVNPDQSIRYMSFNEVLDYLPGKKPGDLLCLGARNGMMSGALNWLETNHRDVFNKNTVYASIKDRDGGVSYSDEVAVFTTFDSSKGLERPIVVLFGYDPGYWELRTSYAGVDYEVMRNVFLVAASRAKSEVIFVYPDNDLLGDFNEETVNEVNDDEHIGFMDIETFTDLPEKHRSVYEDPIPISGAFDFRYGEAVAECRGMLDLTRIDSGDEPVIDIDRTDGLIDLSPVVGIYQEALFFDHNDFAERLAGSHKPELRSLTRMLTGEPWHDSLIVASAETEQRRYRRQVSRTVDPQVMDQLKARLATRLRPDMPVQDEVMVFGTATDLVSGDESSMVFTGLVDAVAGDDGDTVFELKFTSELTDAMFLQTAMYVVAGGFDHGVLWNTRTGECWEVRVGDTAAFMDAVVGCVSKGDYDMWVWPGAVQPADRERKEVRR